MACTAPNILQLRSKQAQIYGDDPIRSDFGPRAPQQRKRWVGCLKESLTVRAPVPVLAGAELLVKCSMYHHSHFRIASRCLDPRSQPCDGQEAGSMTEGEFWVTLFRAQPMRLEEKKARQQQHATEDWGFHSFRPNHVICAANVTEGIMTFGAIWTPAPPGGGLATAPDFECVRCGTRIVKREDFWVRGEV